MKPLTEERILKLILIKSDMLKKANEAGKIIDTLYYHRELKTFLFDLFLSGCYDYKYYKKLMKKYGLSEKKITKHIMKGEHNVYQP